MSKFISTAFSGESEYFLKKCFIGLTVPELEKLLSVF
jgi:hypothetical protein